MGKKIKEIDAYISKSADFAKPILKHIRELVHKACPDVEEKIKWGFPHFDYHNGPMCHMAAFKQHSALGFWKATLMKDGSLVENAKAETAMGHLGKITSLQDLPADKKLMAWIKEAMKLNEQGIKLVPKKTADKKELIVPDYFSKALSKNKQALKNFTEFSYSHKKDYLQWLTEAKTEETRVKRMTTAIEWLAEGKSRNWKYEVKK